MKLKVYEVCDEKILAPLSVTTPRGEWTTDDVQRWVDVENPTADDLQNLLDPFGLHPLILEHCVDSHRGSRVAPYQNALYLELAVRSSWNDLRTRHFSVVCLPTTLITVRSGPSTAIDELAAELASAPLLVSPTAPALLYTLLDRLLARNLRFLMSVRNEIHKVAAELDENPTSVDLSGILTLKRQVRELTTLIEDQLFTVSALRTVESQALRISDLREYFRDLVDVAERAQRGVVRLESWLRDLHQDCLGGLQEITSSRLRIMTILSAVYLPATLIAAVYGMNFDNIPAVEWEYGYFVVFFGMIALIVGQLLFFHRRGWFK